MRRVRVQVKPNLGAKPAGPLPPAKPTGPSCLNQQPVPDIKLSSNDVETEPCSPVAASCHSPSKTPQSSRISTPKSTGSSLKSLPTSSPSLLLPSENAEFHNCNLDSTDPVARSAGAAVSATKVTDTCNADKVDDEIAVAEPVCTVAKLPDGGKTANALEPLGINTVCADGGKVETTGDAESVVANSQLPSRPTQKPAGMTVLACRMKAKPNIATNARVRHVSISEKQPEFVSVATLQAAQPLSADIGESPATGSTQESEPFIPPAAAETAKTLTCLGPGVAMEEIVAAGTQQTASLPSVQRPPAKERLTAEKAAEKMIQKRIQLKKKRRQLESLSGPIDRTKICMRDLIYMNPVNNPMKDSPMKSESKTSVKLNESTADGAANVTNTTNVANGKLQTDDVEADDVSPADEENEAVVVPQVKVGPDGKITLNLDTVVIDKKLHAKEEKKEIVDETYIVRRGYPKKSRCRPWDVRETHKFYGLLSRIGTDFSLMARLFTDRTRMDLKRKFKREEKIHRDLIEKVLGERLGLDITLLAEPSDDEKSNVEPSEAGDEPAGSKKKRRCPSKSRSKDDLSAGAGATKRKSVKAEKENNKPSATGPPSVAMATNAVEAMPPVAVATGDVGGASTLPGDSKSKKARKHQKRLYYEQSSDSEDDLTSSSRSSPSKSKKSKPGSSPAGPQGAEPSSSATTGIESSDDEVQVIQAIGGRATRVGRIPRPMFNPATSSPVETPLVRTKSEQSTSRPRVSKSAVKVSYALPVAAGNPAVVPASASAVNVSDIMSQIARMQQTPKPAQSVPLTAAPGPLQFLPAGGTSVVSPGILGLPPGLFVLVEKPAGNPGSLENQPQSLFHVFALSSGPQDGTGPQGPTATSVIGPALGSNISFGGNPSLVVTSVAAPQIFPPYVAGSSSLTSLRVVSSSVNSAFNSPRISSPRQHSPSKLLASESRLPGLLANMTAPTSDVSADVVRPGLMAACRSPVVRPSASLSSVRLGSGHNASVGPVLPTSPAGQQLTSGVSTLGQQRIVHGPGPVSGQQFLTISPAVNNPVAGCVMQKLQAVGVPMYGQHLAGGLSALSQRSVSSVPALGQHSSRGVGSGMSLGQPTTAGLPTLGQTGSVPVRVIQLSGGSEDLVLESDVQSSGAANGGEIPAEMEDDDDGQFIEIIVEHFGETLD